MEKAFDRETGAWGPVSDLEAGSSPPRALVYSSAKWKVAKLYWRWEIEFSFSTNWQELWLGEDGNL